MLGFVKKKKKKSRNTGFKFQAPGAGALHGELHPKQQKLSQRQVMGL